MLGRTFNALREFRIIRPPNGPEDYSRHEGLQVDLPACTTLELWDCPMDYLRFLSCSNVQILRWSNYSLHAFDLATFDLATFNPLHDFLFNLSCLRKLSIFAPHGFGIDSLVDFVFCGAPEHGVWRDIKSVEVEINFKSTSEKSHFFDQVVGHQQRHGKWWKAFTVTEGELDWSVEVRASM